MELLGSEECDHFYSLMADFHGNYEGHMIADPRLCIAPA